MESAMERELAAETLRTVEGFRRRTLLEAVKSSPFPLFVFGLAALIAAPFGEIGWKHASPIAVGVVLIGAVVASEIHYRRQPVHAAMRRRPTSTGEWIFLAAILIFFGPGVVLGIGALVAISAVSSSAAFVVFSIAAIVMGTRLRNPALGLTGVASFIAGFVAAFVWSDHWETLTPLAYGAGFLGVGFAQRALKRRGA
jgi:hypothetical protein